ncbi:MAG: hypothetical protein HC913_09355 [Microscillaceae bacterium]|nr:hypothetical protein [Microscillaceae bacterium]
MEGIVLIRDSAKAETLLAKYQVWYDEHRKDNFYVGDVILYLLEWRNANGYQRASLHWQIDLNSRNSAYLMLFKKSIKSKGRLSEKKTASKRSRLSAYY